MSFPISNWARVVWLVCYDWLRWRASFKDLVLQVSTHPLLCERARVPNLSPNHTGLTAIMAPDVNITSPSANESRQKLNLSSGLQTRGWFTHTDCLTLYTHISMWFHPHLCFMNVHSWWLADENVSLWSLKSYKCSKMTGRGAAKKQWI